MQFRQFGEALAPILFCIPGLIGGPEDFAGMVEELGNKFCVVIIDPNEKRRNSGGLNLSQKSMEEVSYDSTAEVTRDILVSSFPGREYYFLGLSLGGKVVYDFASKFPDLFCGGVITDVGPGSFSESELFHATEAIVDTVDLNLPWPELKKSLMTSIPDKSLRILIQTQIAYPNKVPPAIWKTGMKNFENLLERQSLDDQESSFFKVDATLAENNRRIHVLHSEHLSGIGEKMFEAMKQLRSIEIHEVYGASHFLHVSHKDLIVRTTLGLLTV